MRGLKYQTPRPFTASMKRMLPVLLTLVLLLLAGCEWNPAQRGAVHLALPCDMSDEHLAAWVDAVEEWRPAFPHELTLTMCDPAARDQIVVAGHVADPEHWSANEVADTVQLGTNRAHGCHIEVYEEFEALAADYQYRNVAAHEIGHCLGLMEHSENTKDLMYYAPRVDRPRASELDAMRKVYE